MYATSPNCNPLGYYFLDALKTGAYKKKRPFANLDQLQGRISIVWQRAINMEHIEKTILQLLSHLQQVRRAIEKHFG